MSLLVGIIIFALVAGWLFIGAVFVLFLKRRKRERQEKREAIYRQVSRCQVCLMDLRAMEAAARKVVADLYHLLQTRDSRTLLHASWVAAQLETRINELNELAASQDAADLKAGMLLCAAPLKPRQDSHSALVFDSKGFAEVPAAELDALVLKLKTELAEAIARFPARSAA